MKKYSKDATKKRVFMKVLLIVFIILLISSIAVFLYVFLNNNIIYEKVDDSSKMVSNEVAKNSSPIIINNVLVGGVYDKKWVSSEKYYLLSNNISNVEVDVYNQNGKKGTYELDSISKGSTSTVYSAIMDANITDEYFAVTKNTISAMNTSPKKRQNVTQEHLKLVKKALGFYNLFNSTVKITEIYDVPLQQGENGMVIFATNEIGKSFGVYSAVVYVDSSNNPKLIKYNYIRDSKYSDNWPVYSFEFVGDLNLDGINEIIIQETKEFEVKYDVLEYDNNNSFKEVISAVVK